MNTLPRYMVYNPPNLLRQVQISGKSINPGKTGGPFVLTDEQVINLRLQTLQVYPYTPPMTDVADKGDYGYVQYSPLSSWAPLVIDTPNTRAQLTFTPDLNPTTRINLLDDPFTNFTFWDGSRLQCRTVNDYLLIRIGFSATATVADGRIFIDLDIATSSPLETKTHLMGNNAGVEERVTELFADYQRTNFKNNGGGFFIKSTVPITVTKPTLVVAPIHAAV